MDRLQSIEVFIAVAEAESFAGAARRLGLSAPSITRGVNALEDRLGVRLFTRTTRQVRLTDVGRSYLDDARHALAQLQAAEDAALGAASAPTGQLRITCSTEFGRIYISRIITDYLDAYPGVSAEVVMVDRMINLVEEGFDVAIRIGPLPSSGLIAVQVGRVRRVVSGAPDYFKIHGLPQTPADLAHHTLISATPVTPGPEWRFGADGATSVAVKSRLKVSSVAAAIEMARQGWGLTRVLSYQVGPDLEAGRLQTVLEAEEPEALPVHLVFAEGRRTPAKVRSFIDFAKSRLKAVAVLN